MTFLELFRDWEDVVEHGAGTVIFQEGAPADVMCVVLDGEVQLTRQDEPLDREGRGGIIGEMAMIESATFNDTAKAVSKVRLARIDRDQFRRLIAENTEFSLHVMAVLANRLRAVDNYVTTQFGRTT
ncbi:MAG: cyclic nucleotide-binding domain-containing protein [Xanthomonadales bacterium]|nr:cyclic nucleotide-binding domain-containing protein [Xanthomonadales bacterium]